MSKITLINLCHNKTIRSKILVLEEYINVYIFRMSPNI